MKDIKDMTELEKLDAGLEYDFCDKEVDARKLNAVIGCQKPEAVSVLDAERREAAILLLPLLDIR